jgi:hypothetical protein
VKFGFLVDHVSSGNDRAVKLSEDEDDDWHSSKLRGVQFEHYTACDSAHEVCEIQSIDQVLDQTFD